MTSLNSMNRKKEGYNIMNAHQWDRLKENIDAMTQHYAEAFGATSYAEAWPWLVWEYGLWGYLAKCGAELRGYSIAQKDGEWLLVLKVVKDSLPYVGFMSGSTPTSCVRKVLTRLEADSLSWYPDKYA